MSKGEHHYRISVQWTGDHGSGTSAYRAYGREYVIRAAGKSDIAGSSDAAFLGDASRWNPEDLLVASVSACHKLWYLHLCADAGVTVFGYLDEAEGTMIENRDGGRFTQIVLRPHVVIKRGDDIELARHLHHDAHEKCYIANSLNFPIECDPTIEYARA